MWPPHIDICNALQLLDLVYLLIFDITKTKVMNVTIKGTKKKFFFLFLFLSFLYIIFVYRKLYFSLFKYFFIVIAIVVDNTHTNVRKTDNNTLAFKHY